MPTCQGCGKCIDDPYLLKVEPDLHWHITCLECNVCHVKFKESATCIMKAGKAYCRLDFARLFSKRCNSCKEAVESVQPVIQVSHFVYHVDCFCCVVCESKLEKGESFYLSKRGPICKMEEEYEARQQTKLNSDFEQETSNDENSTIDNTEETIKDNASTASSSSPIQDQATTTKSKKDKPTRIRTVLNEKQLSTLKSCYNANPRPDALMKERLVEMTGLSARVIRVWFQNKRCKDKKKSISAKQEEDFAIRTFTMHSSPKSDDVSLSGLSSPMATGINQYHDGASENAISRAMVNSFQELPKVPFFNQSKIGTYDTFPWHNRQPSITRECASLGPFQQLMQFSEYGPFHIHEYGSMT